MAVKCGQSEKCKFQEALQGRKSPHFQRGDAAIMLSFFYLYHTGP
jgi:hypothetical protein